MCLSSKTAAGAGFSGVGGLGEGCMGLMTGSPLGWSRLSRRIRLAALGGIWSAGVTSLTSKTAESLGHFVGLRGSSGNRGVEKRITASETDEEVQE